jgi:hypothetical protein
MFAAHSERHSRSNAELCVRPSSTVSNQRVQSGIRLQNGYAYNRTSEYMLVEFLDVEFLDLNFLTCEDSNETWSDIISRFVMWR